MDTSPLLEALLGSAGCCRVLLLLHRLEESYAREIARFWECSLFPVQKQLEKLERGGVLQSRMAGRTRLYRFDPVCPLRREIRHLLDRSMALFPLDTTSRFRSLVCHFPASPRGGLLRGRERRSISRSRAL